MSTVIERRAPVNPPPVYFGANVAGSDTICMANCAAFSVLVPAGVIATQVTWYAASVAEGPYYPVVLTSNTTATTSVVAERVYIAPPELYSCTFVRGVAVVPFTGVVMLKT